MNRADEEEPLTPPSAAARGEERAGHELTSVQGLVIFACAVAFVGGAAITLVVPSPTAAVPATLRADGSQSLSQRTSNTLGTCDGGDHSAIDYFQCPPGAYLQWDAADKAKANERLQSLYKALKSDGLVENTAEASTGVNYATRGYATYESQAWPKPAHCSNVATPSFLTEAWQAEYNGTTLHFDGYSGSLYKKDEAPSYMNKVRSPQYSFEFHYSWKVASTSFPSFLWCEFWPLSSFKEADPVPENYRVAGGVRHPLSRFVSGVLELLERSVNYYCPSGYCTLDNDGFEGNVTLTELDKLTTWYHFVKNGFSADDLPQLLGGFVHDVECNYEFYASEHFTTQATFLTQGEGCAADLGPLVRLEELDEGLDQMVDELKVQQGGSYKNCTMKDSNDASDKPGGLPSEAEMVAVLEKDDALMQRLCKVYAQDYICFGYELPDSCKDLF